MDSYLYDDEGNRIRKTHVVNATTTIHTNYTYDRRNRLTNVVDRLNDPVNGAIQKQVRYTYDAFDRRASRELSNDGDNTFESVERYFYDGDNVVLEWVDPAGAAPMALAKRYLHGPAVDQILAQENLGEALAGDNRVYWFLEDHQGTTRDLANNKGTVVAHYVYDAFGELVSGDTTKSRYLFTGRELDTATGLQYNHHRWYDPHTGRWISEDPIGFAGGDYNLSRYVGNMATTLTDPSGLAPPVPPPIPPDIFTPPGPGWVWKGPSGSQPGGPGNWVGPAGDSLHPDLNHPEPKGPHWGWQDEYKNKWDYFPDRDKWVPDQNNNPNRPQPVFPEGTLETTRNVLLGGTCAYLLWRGLRLLPSFLAPPTFVPNLVCP